MSRPRTFSAKFKEFTGLSINNEGKIVAANKYSLQVLDAADLKQVEQQVLLDLVVPGDQKLVSASLNTIKKGGKIDMNFRFKSGNLVDCHARSTGEGYVLFFGSDATEIRSRDPPIDVIIRANRVTSMDLADDPEAKQSLTDESAKAANAEASKTASPAPASAPVASAPASAPSADSSASASSSDAGNSVKPSQGSVDVPSGSSGSLKAIGNSSDIVSISGAPVVATSAVVHGSSESSEKIASGVSQSAQFASVADESKSSSTAEQQNSDSKSSNTSSASASASNTGAGANAAPSSSSTSASGSSSSSSSGSGSSGPFSISNRGSSKASSSEWIYGAISVGLLLAAGIGFYIVKYRAR